MADVVDLCFMQVKSSLLNVLITRNRLMRKFEWIALPYEAHRSGRRTK